MIQVAARRIVLGPQTSLAFLRQHIGDQKKAVLHVVEGQHVGKIHEDRVVQIDVGGDARRQALQHAHGFIREITHRAGGEGRQAGNLHGMVARAQAAQEFEDVARLLCRGGCDRRAVGDRATIPAHVIGRRGRKRFEKGQRRRTCSGPRARRLPRFRAGNCAGANSRRARAAAKD